MGSFALILVLVTGQIPTPVKLVEARRVFLAGEAIERTVLVELGQQLTEWGRWHLEADEASSDVVVLLRRSASPSDGGAWVITIREPSRSTPLYSDAQSGSYAAGAVTQLVGRLRAVVDGTGFLAPSTPSPPVASAERPPSPALSPAMSPAQTGEPCRVFVTEEKVNPTFFTLVKRIKYAKKYYGGSSHAWEGMAREGWKVDADAVVAVNINFRPSMFSWASPHAEGTAVKWNDEGRKQFRSLVGQCFGRPEK
jgi:hypothetical protein